jgi:hypothetical protein
MGSALNLPLKMLQSNTAAFGIRQRKRIVSGEATKPKFECQSNKLDVSSLSNIDL